MGGGIPSPRATAAAFAGSGISPRDDFSSLTCRKAKVPIGRHGPRPLALRGLRIRLRGRGGGLLDKGLRTRRQARRHREPAVPAAEDLRVHRAEAPLRARLRHGLGTQAGAGDAVARLGVRLLHLRRRDRGHGYRARAGDQADDPPCDTGWLRCEPYTTDWGWLTYDFQMDWGPANSVLSAFYAQIESYEFGWLVSWRAEGERKDNKPAEVPP